MDPIYKESRTKETKKKTNKKKETEMSALNLLQQNWLKALLVLIVKYA